MEQGQRVSVPPLRVILPQSAYVHQLEDLQTLDFGAFMEASLHRHDWWNHWPLVIGLSLQLPPLPGGLCCYSVAQSCMTLWDPMECSTSGFPVLHHPQSMFKLMSIEPSKHLVLSSPYPPAFNLSQHQGLFQWVRSSHQVAKVLEFQLQYQSFRWIFRADFLYVWFDLLAVQGTLKSLFQHHSSKASILQRSAFFMVHLSHLYMTTGKTIALTRQTFVGKVICMLFNMLSRLVITFLPRSKCLLISWLKSPSTVIFGTQENKVCHCFHCFPFYFPWSDGTGCHDLSFSFLNVKCQVSSFTLLFHLH